MATAHSPLTRRRVAALTWPMIFANALIPMVGVIDTAVIGLAGDAAAIGGVALGGAVFSVFYWSVYFLRMGVTGFTAQAIGKGDTSESQRVLARGLVLAVTLGGAALILKQPINVGAFALLQGSAAVESHGSAYVAVRFWGAPAALGLFSVTGWLIGAGRTRSALVLQAVLALINGALDSWFVLKLGWGPAGIAAGTVIAEWVALCLGLFIVFSHFARDGTISWRIFSPSILLDPAALRRMIGVNFDLFIRSICMVIGFTWFANAGARQGDTLLAANQILLQFIVVWAFVLDAFAYTAEAQTGRAVGQHNLPNLRRAVRLTGEFSAISALLFSLLTFVFAPFVIDHIVTDPGVRAAAKAYVPFCAAVPILGALAWLLDGVFIGATFGRAMRNAAIAALVIYLVSDALLTPRLGNAGVWAAFLIYYVARGITLLIAYPSLERRITGQPHP